MEAHEVMESNESTHNEARATGESPTPPTPVPTGPAGLAAPEAPGISTAAPAAQATPPFSAASAAPAAPAGPAAPKVPGKASRSVVRAIQIVCVALIIGLFSCLYCWYFWDPAGNLKDVELGVINRDEGTTIDGVYENLGDDLVDELLTNEDVTFRRLYDDELDEGIENSDYLLVVEIPQDFSERIAAGESSVPQAAELVVHKNVRHNFLFSQYVSQVVTRLQASLDRTISARYVEGAYDGLATASDGLRDAAEGAGELQDGADDLVGGVNDLATGATQLTDATTTLAESADALSDAATTVSGGVGDALTATDQLLAGAQGLTAGLQSLQESLQYAQDMGMGTDATAQTLAALGTAEDPATLLGAANALTAGLTQLKGGDDTGLTAASSALTQISSGLATLSESAPELQEGVTQLSDGISQLSDGATQLADGAGTLATSLTEGADEIDGSLGATGSQVASYLEEPTTLQEEDYGGLDYYGEGLSPFFMTTSLWLGALAIFFVCDPFWRASKHAGRVRTVIGRLPLYLLMCLLNSLAVVVCAVAIGDTSSYDVDGWSFVLFTLAVSVAFMLMMQFLNMTFGLVGKGVAVLLLVIQLVLAGGTLPLELGRGTLDGLQAFLPFTYAIDGFREVITYGDTGVLWGDALVLLGMGLVCLVLSLGFWDLAVRVKAIGDAQALDRMQDEPEPERGRGREQGQGQAGAGSLEGARQG